MGGLFRDSNVKFHVELNAREKKVFFYISYVLTNIVNFLALAGVVIFILLGCSTLQTVMAYSEDINESAAVVFTDATVPSSEDAVQTVFAEASEVSFTVGDNDIKVTANNMIVIAVIYFSVALVLFIALVKTCSISTEAP